MAVSVRRTFHPEATNVGETKIMAIDGVALVGVTLSSGSVGHLEN